MIVSQTKSFIFVHIPKTGGTSVSHVLMPYRRWQEKYLAGRVLRRITRGYSFYGHTHAPVIMARTLLGEKKFSSMLKFSVVRHPVDWHFSIFRWILKWRGERLTAPVYSEAHRIRSFEDYIGWRSDHGHFSQLTQLVDYDGAILVDMICRFESLDNNIDQIFK